MCTTFASRTASYIVRTSPLFTPSGFSHMTCLPCFAAARAIGWWVKLGVAMITASTLGSAQMASGSVVTQSIPHSAFRRFQQGRVGVAGRGQLGPGVELDRRHVVIVADRAGADDGDPHLPARSRVHRLVRPV